MSSKTAVEKRPCKATTKANTPCSVNALEGKQYCGRHKSLETTASAPSASADKPIHKEIKGPKLDEKHSHSDDHSHNNNNVANPRKLPTEFKDSKEICGVTNEKTNIACAVRAKFQCADADNCQECDGHLYCLRDWKKIHPLAMKKINEATGAKTSGTRTIPDDDNRCKHMNKTGEKLQCKSKAHGTDAQGVLACGRHGGPKKDEVVGSKASSGTRKGVSATPSLTDIPFHKMWNIRVATKNNNSAHLKWFDEYIVLSGEAGQTQQTILNHFAKLQDQEDQKIVQSLVNEFGRENMEWFFLKLSKFASIEDSVNKDKIDTVWKAIAAEYNLAIAEHKEPAAKNAVESSKISSARDKGNSLLSKYKNSKTETSDVKVNPAIMQKLQNLKAPKAVITDNNEEEADDMEESIDEDEAGITNDN